MFRVCVCSVCMGAVPGCVELVCSKSVGMYRSFVCVPTFCGCVRVRAEFVWLRSLYGWRACRSFVQSRCARGNASECSCDLTPNVSCRTHE